MIALTFAIAQQAGSLSLISLLGFIAGFAVGPGPIPWIYNSELFPANSRSASGMVGCIVNWGFNFIVAKFFPALEESMGSNVFWIFIIFSIVTVFYCYSVVPETKNKSANEVYNMFAKRNGVAEEQEEEMQDLRENQN
jgi:SP family facilitated glucose/fructose transporter-like MFS transporter 5